MAEKPALHLEELNLKYEGGKTRETRLPRTNRWRLAGFYLHPRQGGLGGVTFYPDPDHTWDGGTQEGRQN